jgi:chromate transporter
MSRIGPSRLARAFAWIGLTSIGGGRYAFLHDALVVRRSWVRNDEFAQDLALCQLLPGPNFSNLAVALGTRLSGWRGALCGGVALVLPGAIILLALGALYFRVGLAPGLSHAMRGTGAAVVGLVFVATASIASAALRGWRAILIAAATFALVGPLHVHTALAIALVAPASLWLQRPRRPTS